MKWIVLILVVANVWSYVPERNIEYHNSIDIADTEMVADLQNNTCKFKTKLTFEENIKVDFYSLPDIEQDKRYTVGWWSEETNTISLEETLGVTIDVVAHEVSHAVDTLMERHQPKEQHYRAYLQGHMTECVWKIVESKQ